MDLSFINFNIWIIQSIAMGLTALLIPRLRITSIFGALLMVVGLALVNAHIWDAALFMSIPDSLGMHTLILMAVNGTIFWILVKLLPGIEVDGILPALIAPTVFSITSILLTTYGADIDFLGIGKKGLATIEATKEQIKHGREEAEKTRKRDGSDE